MIFYPLSYVTCRHIQYADLHGCNVLCCRYFLRRVRVRFRVTVYTQLVVGVYWDSTPLTASAEIFKVYISFTLFYMWLHFDIYIDVLCVPAYWSRDGTETQRLDSSWVGSLHDDEERLVGLVRDEADEDLQLRVELALVCEALEPNLVKHLQAALKFSHCVWDHSP